MSDGNEKGIPRSGDDYIEIGIIRKPVGLAGWCGITLNGKTLDRLELPCEVFTGLDVNCLQKKTLTEIRPGNNGPQGRFLGYDDRDKADELKGLRIFIEKNRLPSLENGGYYHFELVGMNVFTPEGDKLLGVVTKVNNYPSVDALEIRKADGTDTLVPLTKGIVRSIDRDKKIIILSVNNIDDIFD